MAHIISGIHQAYESASRSRWEIVPLPNGYSITNYAKDDTNKLNNNQRLPKNERHISGIKYPKKMRLMKNTKQEWTVYTTTVKKLIQNKAITLLF